MLAALTESASRFTAIAVLALCCAGAAYPVWATASANGASGANLGTTLAAAENASVDLGVNLAESAPRGPQVSLGSTNRGRSGLARLPAASQEAAGFDWSSLICLAFGVAGLVWIRRRSAAL